MPFPSAFSEYMPEHVHLSRSTVDHCWSLWPRRCSVSNRLLWFTKAYRARRIITGPGEPVIVDRWYGPLEFLILQLKEI